MSYDVFWYMVDGIEWYILQTCTTGKMESESLSNFDLHYVNLMYNNVLIKISCIDMEIYS